MEVTKFPLGLIGCFFETLQDPHPANVKLIIMKQKIIKKEKYFIITFISKYEKDGLEGLSTQDHLENLFCK